MCPIHFIQRNTALVRKRQTWLILTQYLLDENRLAIYENNTFTHQEYALSKS